MSLHSPFRDVWCTPQCVPRRDSKKSATPWLPRGSKHSRRSISPLHLTNLRLDCCCWMLIAVYIFPKAKVIPNQMAHNNFWNKFFALWNGMIHLATSFNFKDHTSEWCLKLIVATKWITNECTSSNRFSILHEVTCAFGKVWYLVQWILGLDTLDLEGGFDLETTFDWLLTCDRFWSLHNSTMALETTNWV